MNLILNIIARNCETFFSRKEGKKWKNEHFICGSPCEFASVLSQQPNDIGSTYESTGYIEREACLNSLLRIAVFARSKVVVQKRFGIIKMGFQIEANGVFIRSTRFTKRNYNPIHQDIRITYTTNMSCS